MKGKDSIGIKIQAALESKLCSKHCTLFFTQGVAWEIVTISICSYGCLQFDTIQLLY